MSDVGVTIPSWLPPETDRIYAAVLDLRQGDKFYIRDALRGKPREGVWKVLKRVTGGWRMEMQPDGEFDTFTDKDIRDLRHDRALVPLHRNPLNVPEAKLARILAPREAKPLRTQLELDAKNAYCDLVADLMAGRETREGYRLADDRDGSPPGTGIETSMVVATPMTLLEACAISAERTYERNRKHWEERIREIRAAELTAKHGEVRIPAANDPKLRTKALCKVTGKAVAKWWKARTGSSRPDLILTSDNSKKGNRARRSMVLIDGRSVYEIMADAGDRYYAVPEKMSARAIHRMLCRDPAFKAEVSSHVTLQKFLDDRYPKFDLAVAWDGVEVANSRYGLFERTRRPARPLEEIEIDHCLADIIVLDDEYGSRLGRPWITAAFDRCTKMIVGIHMSFEVPSWASVSRCLTHAFWPKDLRAYRLENGADPERTIRQDWPCEGICGTLFSDQGAEFDSGSMEAATAAMGFAHAPLTGRSPWLKGALERFFRRMHAEVFSWREGYTFENVVARGSYDSVGKARIRYSELKFELLKWIVDHYHVEYQRGLEDYPLAAWRKQSHGQRVRPAPDLGYLTQLLGAAEKRVIGKNGIRVKGHVYRHPIMEDLRRSRPGESYHVRYDPFDLGSIWFLPDEGGSYVQVWSDRPEETVGISVYVSRKRKEFIKRFGDAMTPEDDLTLIRELDARARDVMTDAGSTRTIAKVARYYLPNGAFFTPVALWDGKPPVHPMLSDVVTVPSEPPVVEPDVALLSVDPAPSTGTNREETAAVVDGEPSVDVAKLIEETRRRIRMEDET